MVQLIIDLLVMTLLIGFWILLGLKVVRCTDNWEKFELYVVKYE